MRKLLGALILSLGLFAIGSCGQAPIVGQSSDELGASSCHGSGGGEGSGSGALEPRSG